MRLFSIVVDFSEDGEGDWVSYGDNRDLLAMLDKKDFEFTLNRLALALGGKETDRVIVHRYSAQLVLADSIEDAMRVYRESNGVIDGKILEVKLIADGILCQRYASITVDMDGWINGE